MADIIGIFKFGKLRYMEDLLYRGHVYMNPVSRFKTVDDGTPRFDPDEGTVYSKPMDGWSIDIEHKGTWVRLGTAIGSGRFSSDALCRANLYCLHACTTSDYGSVLEFDKLGFGEAFVAFRNPAEFVRRLMRAATAAGQDLVGGLVDYVDRATYEGPMGPLRKYAEHSAESEFRIAALPGTGNPLSLHLGDLSDIAIIGPTDKRVRLDPLPARL